ncbi:hypothetical protein EG329_013440 [Mollisiaceae sp. DMI_Dod_QoI]|nr:hypothetical protein EG329_013440 [Helotiales sp. DMI_Dod_QoI]
MESIKLLVLVLLRAALATPVTSTISILELPAATSALSIFLDSVYKDAGSLSQLPKQPWPADDNQKKSSALKGTVCGVVFSVVAAGLVLWYLNYKKKEYERQRETVVIVTETVEVARS